MKKKILIGSLIVVSLAAIAMVATQPSWLATLVLGDEGAVKKRAQGYWNARLEGDLKKMAPYVHPLQKAVQENDMLETRSFEITGVTVQGDEALVGIKAKYRVKLARTSSAERELTQEDRWVRYEGQWYHALHPVGFGEVLQQGLGRWKPKTSPPPAGHAARPESVGADRRGGSLIDGPADTTPAPRSARRRTAGRAPDTIRTRRAEMSAIRSLAIQRHVETFKGTIVGHAASGHAPTRLCRPGDGRETSSRPAR